jgi:DNA polymerase-3 subunit epsilon
MKKYRLAFVDTETTGLSPQKHEIIEIACVLAEQVDRPGRGPELKFIEEFEIKVKPLRIQDAEPEALRINGYNETDWLFAVDLKNALELLSKKAEGAIMVSHNMAFDFAFLDKAFQDTGVKNLMHYQKMDTISIAFAKLYDKAEHDKYSLRYLCEIFNIKNEKAHTALSDTKALFEVYKKLMSA